MKSGWTITDESAGQRLDRFLAAPERLGSRGRVLAAIDRGKVFVNEQEAGRPDAGAALQRGDVVRLWMDRPGSAKRRAGTAAGDLRIIYEDASLLVVDKPAGLLSVPLKSSRDASSAYDQIAERLGPRAKRTPLVVHRIDRDTSGLVVFAKDRRAQEHLKDQFERREPERVYLAVVYGHPVPPEGTWRDRLLWDEDALVQTRATERDPNGKEAISRYRIVERLPGVSLIEVRLETGKRNQIRVQSALRGHPLVGEKQYVQPPAPRHPIAFPRQALHAHRLAFRHPVDGRALRLESPLPPDMVTLIERLRR